MEYCSYLEKLMPVRLPTILLGLLMLPVISGADEVDLDDIDTESGAGFHFLEQEGLVDA